LRYDKIAFAPESWQHSENGNRTWKNIIKGGLSAKDILEIPEVKITTYRNETHTWPYTDKPDPLTFSKLLAP